MFESAEAHVLLESAEWVSVSLSRGRQAVMTGPGFLYRLIGFIIRIFGDVTSNMTTINGGL